MRAVSAIALLALLLVGSCSASIAARSEPVRAPSPTSPWKIVEDWNVTLPAGGMQIFPAYTSVPGLYVATTSTGIVCGINTTTRSIQWQQQYPDIAFVSALESTGAIFVARYSGTTVLDSVTGNQIWFAANVTMSPNLAESYNALVFGKTIVYRDESLGYTRLCAVDGETGNQLWCDNRRTLGSPDAARDNTFTAQLFDVNGSAYVANIDATTGKENWFAFADRVITGNMKYVAVVYQNVLVIVNSMTGLHSAYYNVSTIAPIHNAVFVKQDIFVFTDGHSWVAAVDCTTGKLMWNVTAPNGGAAWRIDMQHQGENILIVATLSSKHTNFTRLSALTGAVEWTVSAMPTGMSLAPVHAWLADAILYVRNTNNRWSAWGADSGLEISSGSGDLFLPRSVMPAYTREGYSFYVTTNGGQMIDLRVERK